MFVHFSPLVHTLYPMEDTEMCLITKNEKAAIKSLLEEKKVEGVTKVQLESQKSTLVMVKGLTRLNSTHTIKI